MKHPFTVSLRLLLLALALGTGFTSRGQIVPQPVAVTGFNADIVANGTGNATAGSSSNSSVDANSYVFLSNDYTTTTAPGFFHPNVGLPYGQTFLGAATPNVLYRLQPYAANNSLRLYGVGGTTPATTAVGTLTLTTPAPAGTLYVLATSGSGSDATTAQVNFADGTNQTFTFTVQDWFNNTPYAYSVNDRVLVTGTNFDAIIANTSTPNPRLYQYALALSAANATKNITNITFTKSTSSGTYVQIMAVSAAPATVNNFTPLTLTFPAAGAPAIYSGTAFTTPSVSGQDVIANGTTGNTITTGTTTNPYTNTAATADTDGAGYFLVATDYNSATTSHPTYGLPVAGVNSVATTGLLTSLATTGVSYQLADYSGVNALQIRGVGSGAVSFAATAATEVYVLTTSTNSTTSTGTMTVNFSDGSTHAYAVNFNNWFNTPTSASSTTLSNATTAIGAYAKGRLQPGNTVQASTTTPYLFENKLVLSPSEYSKTITSITVENTSTSNAVSVLAVTANANSTSVAQCTAPTGHTTTASVATACAATTFSLNVLGLPAVPGYTYQWQSSTDNATWTNLTTATTASPYSTNPTSAACTVLNQNVATYYRCLVQCAFTTGAGVASASVQVGQTDPINCYAYPATSTSGCTTYGSITAVQIAETATPANVVLNKTGLSCATTTEPYATYGIYRDAAANGTLDKSKDYTLTVTTSATSRAALWIDLNRDGVYGSVTNSTTDPTGEYFGENLNAAGGTALTFSVPAAALAAVANGAVGVRVRTERNNATVLSTAGNNNATTVYGETLDYAVIVTGATPCAGTPTATAPVTSSSTACPGSSITLTAAGPALGTTGLTYQWEYKLSSATAFTSVPATITDVNGVAVATNSTTAILTIVNQRAASDYRVTITCANGGASATSPVTTVAQSAIANCYCQNSNNATNEYLTNVTLKDINNTSGSSQSNTPTGFIDYTTNPTATQTTTLNRNATYTISVAALSASTTPTEMVWIDYDQSGTFDANEYTLIGTQSSTGAVTGSTTLTIPTTALLGVTRMRVRMHNDATGTSTSSCTNGWNGETEDYRITIGQELVCTGTPPAITATASATTACASAAIVLTAAGPAAGTTGLSYQWQSKLATATTFANLGTAQTTATYTVTGQAAATDYRVVVTCTASNLSATSNTVSVAQSPFLNCYCTPVTSGLSTDGITNVTLGALNSSSSATNTSPYYTDYSATQTAGTLAIPALLQSSTASVSVTMGADANQYSGVWIDFDHSGTFDTGEFFTLGTNAGSNGTSVIPITIPATALTGQTKMRVRGGDDVVLLNTQSCTAASSTSNYGEVEDYLVSIVAPTPCAATPPTATATASVATACTATSFTLNASGIAATVTGLSYQWQSRPTGSTTAFANLGTAQATAAYTVTGQTVATDYRLVVTCTSSTQTSTSNVVAVAQSAFTACYCTVISTGTNEYIKSVTLPGAPGFTNATGANSTNGYGDFTANTAYTTTIARGTTYSNVSVTVRANNTGSQGGLWVDYNQNGVFDASEYTLVGSSNATGTDVTFPVTLVVPTTAVAGPTRMRIRWRNSAFTSADACLSNTAAGCTTGCNWFGETEDYLVTISATPLATTSANAAAKLALYPNPTQAVATLTGAEAGAAVQVLDVLSRVVLTVKADATGKATLQLPAGLAKGVYLVRTGQQAARLVLE